MKIDNPKVIQIADRIVQSGNQVYLVGGCVRDYFNNKQPHDYDLVTNLHPDQIIEMFKDRSAVIVGKSFDVGVVAVDGIDVATYRKDVYSDNETHTNGANTVEFVSTIDEDLSRRDFTINAIAMKYPSFEIVDLFNGIADIKNKTLKFVGNPYDRIKEDPCRILRALRFSCEFNNMYTLDKIAMKECYMAVQLVDKDRVRLELMKTLSNYDDCTNFFKYADEFGILVWLFPEIDDCIGVEGGFHHKETVYEHLILAANGICKKYPLIRLAGILHDIGKVSTISKDADGSIHFYGHEAESEKMARKILKRLNFSNDDTEYVCELILNHMFFYDKITKDSAYRRLMNRLQCASVRDLLRLRIGDRVGNLDNVGKPVITYAFKRTLLKIRQIEREEQAFKLSDLKIDGNDLIAMGYKPSKEFRRILNNCMELVIEYPETNEKQKLMEYVKLIAGEK